MRRSSSNLYSIPAAIGCAGSGGPTLSNRLPGIHVYGKHVNHTDRSQFDPGQRTERAFMIGTA